VQVIFQTFFQEDTQARSGSASRAEKLFRTSAQGTSNTTATIPAVHDLRKEKYMCQKEGT